MYIHQNSIRGETVMKVNSEFVPIKELKDDNKPQNRDSGTEKTGKQEDHVTFLNDNIRLVMEENRSASDTKLSDLKKAEKEINNLKSKLLEDTSAASKIHQLGNKRVLFLSLDKN